MWWQSSWWHCWVGLLEAVPITSSVCGDDYKLCEKSNKGLQSPSFIAPGLNVVKNQVHDHARGLQMLNRNG